MQVPIFYLGGAPLLPKVGRALHLYSAAMQVTIFTIRVPTDLEISSGLQYVTLMFYLLLLSTLEKNKNVTEE